MQCFSFLNFTSIKCGVTQNRHRDFKFNGFFISTTLKRPVNNMWLHGVFYYKYKYFQKFPIDLWENVCGWLNKNSKSYLLDWSLAFFKNYTNLNHSCPYEGDMLIRADSYQFGHLVNFGNYLPSGRFRMDVNLTEGRSKPAMVGTQIIFSIN